MPRDAPLLRKKIILGVCGSIAAYKAALLTRLLVKSGAEVRVVMTQAAQTFITPLTLATLSKNPVLSSFTADPEQGLWNNHVDLGLWADAIVIAPASTHSLAKMAQGLCNDLLTAVYLSARCPVWIAPAMDLDMYRHQSTQENLARLRKAGNLIIEAEEGELASGLSGIGRMAEPEHIIDHLQAFFKQQQLLEGKKVLITAGPTHEAIDPVRFISNASSGKMGFALAAAAAGMGATVRLISGPTALTVAHPSIHTEKVRSAEEMYTACQQYFEETDVAIFAAAVSDYMPAVQYKEKFKKKDDTLTITLKKTPDIAKSLGSRKKPHQFVVGFALETTDEVENARKKIRAKNLDMIVLNSLNDPGAGFGYDTNQVHLLFKDTGEVKTLALKDKKEVAKDILQAITEKIST